MAVYETAVTKFVLQLKFLHEILYNSQFKIRICKSAHSYNRRIRVDIPSYIIFPWYPSCQMSQIEDISTTFTNNLRRSSVSENIVFCLTPSSFLVYSDSFRFNFQKNEKDVDEHGAKLASLGKHTSNWHSTLTSVKFSTFWDADGLHFRKKWV